MRGGLALADLAGQDLHGQGVLDLLLDRPLEGAGAVDGVVALVGQQGLGLAGDLHTDLAVGQPPPEKLHLQVDDAQDGILLQRPEDDDFVDAVQEFGPEMAFQDGLDLPFHGREILPVILDRLAAQVGGHDDEGVLEVDGPALAVGQPAVVQDLQQDVEHVRVGLLDLVQEDDRIGPALDGLGQLAALLVPDIARRGPDQPGDGVFFHVFGHVESDQRLLRVEEELGQGPGQLGLADARSVPGR